MKPAGEPPFDPKARPIGGPAGPTTLAAFVNLDEPDMRVLDLKIGLTAAFCRLRAESGLTQEGAAERIGVNRAQIARLEAHSSGRVPTLDFLVMAFFAIGGIAEELCALVRATDRAMER